MPLTYVGISACTVLQCSFMHRTATFQVLGRAIEIIRKKTKENKSFFVMKKKKKKKRIESDIKVYNETLNMKLHWPEINLYLHSLFANFSFFLFFHSRLIFRLYCTKVLLCVVQHTHTWTIKRFQNIFQLFFFFILIFSICIASGIPCKHNKFSRIELACSKAKILRKSELRTTIVANFYFFFCALLLYLFGFGLFFLSSQSVLILVSDLKLVVS